MIFFWVNIFNLWVRKRMFDFRMPFSKEWGISKKKTLCVQNTMEEETPINFKRLEILKSKEDLKTFGGIFHILCIIKFDNLESPVF